MTSGGRTFKNPYFKKSRNETVIKHPAMQKVSKVRIFFCREMFAISVKLINSTDACV